MFAQICANIRLLSSGSSRTWRRRYVTSRRMYDTDKYSSPAVQLKNCHFSCLGSVNTPSESPHAAARLVYFIAYCNTPENNEIPAAR